MRVVVGIHLAFLSILVITAVPLIAPPCDGVVLPGCDAFLGLYILGLALILAICLAIRALLDRPSPLVIVDAFVGATFFPLVGPSDMAAFYGPVVALAMLGIAAFAVAGLVSAAVDVAPHAIERWVAVAGLAGIAVLFGSGSGLTVAVLVPLLGIAAVIVAVAVSGRQPRLAAGRPAAPP